MDEFNEKTCAQNLHLTERTLLAQVGDALQCMAIV